MTNAFTRGSAPGRARCEDQRPGSFKKGHKKLGGRQRGTPNKLSPEYRKDILEAARRVGWDCNGLFGIGGYLAWVGCNYPNILLLGILGNLMELQELEIGLRGKPQATLEGFDEAARKRAKRKQTQPPDPEAPWAWTGQDAPVGPLMHLAIMDPKAFCALLQKMLPRPTARQRERAELQREIAAGRAWRERLRAEERRRAEERMRADQKSGLIVEENIGCHEE